MNCRFVGQIKTKGFFIGLDILDLGDISQPQMRAQRGQTSAQLGAKSTGGTGHQNSVETGSGHLVT
jgi:hypothetical protein